MAVEARAIPRLARYSDIGLAVGLIGIIVLMVIPLPTFLLDVMLSLSITIAMIIMMVSI